MRRITGWLVVALMALVSSGFATAQESDRISALEQRLEEQQEAIDALMAGGGGFTVKWSNGLKFSSADGRFTVGIGGRVHHDWSWFSQDRKNTSVLGEAEDGTEFRRVRMYMAGTLHEVIFYKVQVDFEDGETDFKDVYIGMKNVPVVGNVRVGQQYEPFGLEELTSSNYITFIERGATSAVTAERNTGFLIYDTCAEEMVQWATGIFREVDKFGDGSDDGAYAFTSRVSASPHYTEGGESVVHVGAAFSERRPLDKIVDISHAEFKQGPRVIDTGPIATDRYQLFGGEAAVVHGPLSIQGEYVLVRLDADMASDPRFNAWYVMASYFLTGERRPYSRKKGTFGRVKPKTPFAVDGEGCGAWELAARISSHDFDSAGISGGQSDNATAGLNWYLNPNARVMWNYVHSHVKGAGNIAGFTVRFQVDF